MVVALHVPRKEQARREAGTSSEAHRFDTQTSSKAFLIYHHNAESQ